MKTFKCLFVFFLISSNTFSQKAAFFGFGMGFDYGGVGIRAEANLTNHFSLFFGCGYNFADIGYNVGANIKFTHDKRVVPYLVGMYGYNAVIKVANWSAEGTKTYYGPTFGVGIDVFGANLKNKLSMAFLVPVRSSKFKDDFDRFERQGVKFDTKPTPVAFSIGYNIRLNRKK